MIYLEEPPWLAWLHLRKSSAASLEDASLHIGGEFVSLASVAQVTVSKPWLLAYLLGGRNVEVSYWSKRSKVTHTFLARKQDAQRLKDQIGHAVHVYLGRLLTRIEVAADEMAGRQSAIYNPHRYVRYSVAKHFAEKESECFKKDSRQAELLGKHSMLSRIDGDRARRVQAGFVALHPYIESPEVARDAHNTCYRTHWKVAEAAYFQSVESSPLTDEQIESALTFEDATLVVAAAGSGKSSCIVGKIGLALKMGLFEDHEILALAYNKKAAEGLKKRLDQKLGVALGRSVSVASKTFHGFGLATLMQRYGVGYEPKVLKEDEGEEGRFIKTVIADLVSEDDGFQSALTLWLSLSPYEGPQPVGAGGDLDACAKRYEDCCLERLRLRRDPAKKPWSPSIPTFKQGIYVRSFEERAIANWLTLHGIAFEYELPDWDGAKRLGLGTHASGKSKPYNPDFTYTYTEAHPRGGTRTVRVVHEHFALDAHGHAPEWMGGKKYEKHAEQKRGMYRTWMREPADGRERVVFLETTSAQMRDGSIWENLNRNLSRAGIQAGAPDPAVRAKALQQFRESSDLEKLIIDFVLRYKDSGFTEIQVGEAAKRSPSSYRAALFLKVAFMVFQAYQVALKRAEKIDFADMLRDAVDAIQSKRVTTPYRFVLVDEFQDIARLKADLVKAVLNQFPDESIVFCVGDDWQTINRFSGSDVSIFTNVSDYFSRHTHRLELTRTFRCAQGIADVARSLVMRNPGQFDKQIHAPTAKIPGCVRIVHHADAAEGRQAALLAELERILETGTALGITRPSVQILRRTKKDTTVPDGLNSEYLSNLIRRFSGRLTIELHTVHGSKGLEADFVILPGLDSGFRGFPDERPPEPLLDLVLPQLQNNVEEERRLMYVGLTRARHMVSVLASSVRPSEFVLELEAVRHTYPAIEWIEHEEVRTPCPKCQRGSLVLHRGKSTAKACSRSVSCGYREGSQAMKAVK